MWGGGGSLRSASANSVYSLQNENKYIKDTNTYTFDIKGAQCRVSNVNAK